MAHATAVKAGSVLIQCPQCNTAVSVTVTCHIDHGELAHQGEASLVCTPDMTDLWAHTWTHDD